MMTILVQSHHQPPEYNAKPESRKPIPKYFFAQDRVASYNQQVSEETFLAKFDEEVAAFREHLLVNGKAVIINCDSNVRYWTENKSKFPLLFKLNGLLININSSSACIERFCFDLRNCSEKQIE